MFIHTVRPNVTSVTEILDNRLLLFCEKNYKLLMAEIVIQKSNNKIIQLIQILPSPFSIIIESKMMNLTS